MSSSYQKDYQSGGNLPDCKFHDPPYQAVKARLAVMLLQHHIKYHHWLGKHGRSYR